MLMLRISVPLAVAVGALAACGPGDRSRGEPVALAEADSGANITAPVGKEIVLTLSTTPGTGYGWMLVDSGVPALRLLEGVAVTRDSASSAKVGAPATATWKFRADATGSGTIRLEYRRPWERDVAPARLYQVSVEVR
jgi:inhibitor of cysteine peptidase